MHDTALHELAATAASRADLWVRFVTAVEARFVAEIGVYRGEFAAAVLDRCLGIERYYMIDPWRHLDDWDKPANKTDEVFERYLAEALEKTTAHEARRVVLRGRTTEVIGEIPDGSLDFAYIDADHTLRGIAIDLARVFPKVRDGGWIGGDDFCRSIWQHDERFEPTFVFPYAVHFAEAMDARIHALGRNQFVIEKSAAQGHAFVDPGGRYPDLGVRSQVARPPARSGSRSPAESDPGRSMRRGIARALGALHRP